MNFLPQLQPGPDSDIAQLSFLLPSLSFFFLSFFWINFSIAIHHGKVPHSLSSRLIDNARKMLEGRIGFFLKTFPFFVLLMLHIHLKGRDLSNSSYLSTARLPRSLTSGPQSCFSVLFQALSRCVKHLLDGHFQMPTRCSSNTRFPPPGSPTIPAAETAQHSGGTAVNQHPPGPACWNLWAN